MKIVEMYTFNNFHLGLLDLLIFIILIPAHSKCLPAILSIFLFVLILNEIGFVGFWILEIFYSLLVLGQANTLILVRLLTTTRPSIHFNNFHLGLWLLPQKISSWI